MKKMLLGLENLHVESFDTSPLVRGSRGTVRGNSGQVPGGTGGGEYTCDTGCGGTQYYTCELTCEANCVFYTHEGDTCFGGCFSESRGAPGSCTSSCPANC